jgi:transposase InsO family protein
VKKLCRLFGVFQSGYYAWLNRPQSKRHTENVKLLKLINQAHNQSRGIYGSPRITASLKAKGISCSKNRVARLMRDNNIRSKMKRKFKAITNSRHNYPVAENILDQCFNVVKPNKAWVADITYIPTGEGWLYLAAVMDLYNRRVVGWAMDSTMTRQLVMDALTQAVKRFKPSEGIVHHSDRGCQYASKEYQELLKKYGFKASMSRKGNCYDNACMESFFESLKTELIYLTRFRTRAQTRLAIFEYIEIFYNRIRLHSKLGYKAPADFGRPSRVA